MKILKILLLIIALLIIGIGVLYIASPSNVHVERSIVIETSPGQIFSEVNNLKKWNNWDPWYKLDTAMQQEYEGPEEGTGMIRRWESEHEQVGKGEMEIMESELNKSIKTELRFGEQGTGHGDWKFEETEEGTMVTWSFDSDASGMFRLMAFFMDDIMGSVFEQGLNDLKTIAENKPFEPAYEINTVDLTPTWFLTLKGNTPSTQIGAKLGELFGQVVGFAQQNSASIIGQPIAFYYDYDPEGATNLEAGIPIADSIKVSGKFEIRKVEGQALLIKYFGNYNGSEAAYKTMEEYMKANNLEQNGPSWEQYITDPITQPDTSKWETHIYFPI